MCKVCGKDCEEEICYACMTKGNNIIDSIRSELNEGSIYKISLLKKKLELMNLRIEDGRVKILNDTHSSSSKSSSSSQSSNSSI